MTRLLRAAVVLLFVSLSACTTQTALPTGVQLILTDELKDAPSQELNINLVEQCKNLGYEKCEGWTPGEDKGRFKIGTPKYMVVALNGLKPNTFTIVEWKLSDPDDALVMRQSMPITMPGNWRNNEVLHLYLRSPFFRSGK